MKDKMSFNNSNRIKVLLVDDHAVVRAGFKLLLSTEQTIDVVAEAERGEQALQLYSDLRPDVIMMDLSMAGIGGLETIHRIRLRDHSAKIIVFSVHYEKVYVQRALRAGAKGYVCKQAHPDILITAIKTVAQGKYYIQENLVDDDDKSIVTQWQSDSYEALIESLTAREFDIFLLLAQGFTTPMISEQLCLSYKTVANYATTIRNKLGVNTTAEIAKIAIDFNLIL
jgi:DNA-binding NarL/FixJ family response regulator